MRFINKLFNNNKADCPRCLGKGNVDLEDIKRLKKELYWMPGRCAYCNGIGKISSRRATTLAIDLEYLTNELHRGERRRLINGDIGALQRAKEHKKEINEIIEQIEHMYYIKNQNIQQIADHFLDGDRSGNLSTERQQTIDYIELVIKRKLIKE